MKAVRFIKACGIASTLMLLGAGESPVDLGSGAPPVLKLGYGKLSSAVFSPDGKTLLTGSADGCARLWDVASGVVTRTFAERKEGLKVHVEGLKDAAFSPDGKAILTGSADDCFATLWDLKTGAELRKFPEPMGGVDFVAFSPDGARILTGNPHSIEFWDISCGSTVLSVVRDPQDIECCALSPDGKYLAAGLREGPVLLFDGSSGAEIRKFESHSKYSVCMAFSPDGQKLLSDSCDRYAVLWDVMTGARLQIVEHERDVVAVAFSPDGKMFLTGSEDQTAKLWNAATGKEVRVFRGHNQRVRPVAFSLTAKRSLLEGTIARPSCGTWRPAKKPRLSWDIPAPSTVPSTPVTVPQFLLGSGTAGQTCGTRRKASLSARFRTHAYA